MKALVVYESLFGNTEKVAHAIATGLRPYLAVGIFDVGAVPPPAREHADLIVVGGPTHAFSMTRPSTREDAARQGATHGARSGGIREWLKGLDKGNATQLVATFDTRVDKVRHLPGSAAKSASRTLRHLGYSPAVEPESFYVHDTAGPLLSGELERAQAWGAHLAAQAREGVECAVN